MREMDPTVCPTTTTTTITTILPLLLLLHYYYYYNYYQVAEANLQSDREPISFEVPV